jgi:pimeloyl-ACP methyl ester carboxylesterase
MQNRAVYAMDYLGQGKSWPKDCDDGNSPNEKGLIYSADTWGDQIIQFIEQVIMPENENAKVHVVGNSVGGLLACVLAVRRPDLVESIILLNATPIWGLNLPFWSGHLPAPAIPKRIGRFLFDRIRDPRTIEKYLDTCYANRNAFDKELMDQIRSCTEGKGGHAAFTSILWSPPATFLPVSDTVSLKKAQAFFDNIPAIQCDVLLLFGSDDPWCKPAFAKKMIRVFRKRTFPHNPACRYIELERVGHCPNHEAPQAVAKVLRAWVAATQRDKDHLTLVEGEKEIFHEDWADIVMLEKDEAEIPLKLADRLATTII